MPAKNEEQRRLFGHALAIKRGKAKNGYAPAKKIAETMSESKIREFAKKLAKRRKKK